MEEACVGWVGDQLACCSEIGSWDFTDWGCIVPAASGTWFGTHHTLAGTFLLLRTLFS
jgi:hypothetical protein